MLLFFSRIQLYVFKSDFTHFKLNFFYHTFLYVFALAFRFCNLILCALFFFYFILTVYLFLPKCLREFSQSAQ